MNEAEFKDFRAKIALPLAVSVTWLERKNEYVPEYSKRRGVAISFILQGIDHCYAVILTDDKKIKCVKISDLEVDA